MRTHLKRQASIAWLLTKTWLGIAFFITKAALRGVWWDIVRTLGFPVQPSGRNADPDEYFTPQCICGEVDKLLPNQDPYQPDWRWSDGAWAGVRHLFSSTLEGAVTYWRINKVRRTVEKAHGEPVTDEHWQIFCDYLVTEN